MLPLKTVAVIGNGIMGHGIAEVFAAAGFEAILIGRNEESLDRALSKMQASLEEFADNKLLKDTPQKVMRRVRTVTNLDAAAEAELVIEAVPEDMQLKLSIFERLDRVCGPEAILASSSGHPASELTVNVTNKERVIAVHFWYPPQLLPLVEVCGAPETSREVIDWICERLREAGKEPVVIDKEVPGFIGNRIQFAILREAWSLWASGAASADAIDAVVRNSIGRRLGITGPIESADLAGLATMYKFAEFLQPTLDVSAFPPRSLDPMRVAPLQTVHNRDTKAWADLLSARRHDLFRWISQDRSMHSDGTRQR
jgi:3-hydroxybutyryl-CoA dehydrogenase